MLKLGEQLKESIALEREFGEQGRHQEANFRKV